MIAPLIAGGIALLLSVFGTAFATRYLATRGRNQPILVMNDDNLAVPPHAVRPPWVASHWWSPRWPVT